MKKEKSMIQKNLTEDRFKTEAAGIDFQNKQVSSALYRHMTIEIVEWGPFANSDLKKNWNYYLYIYRKNCPDFDRLWLSPMSSWPEFPSLVTYDYAGLDVAQCYWHGGVTFYAKHGGDSIGSQAVQLGCDFAHLFDTERGWDYTFQDIAAEARRTADEVADILKLNG